MNSEEFVKSIRQVVADSSVAGCIRTYENPPGRKPNPNLLQISEWFKELSPENRMMVEKAMKDAVDSCVFGFFCVLDGVRAIEEAGEKGTLKLYYAKESSRELLNDPNATYLHDIYRDEA